MTPRAPAPDCQPWHASPSPRWFTRAAIRQLDRLATNEFAIPSIVLMENAAIRIAEFAAGVLPRSPQSSILILCGPGNNGGDGLATSRHLANAGFRTTIVTAAPAARYSGDALLNLEVARRAGLDLFEASPTAPRDAVDQAISSFGPGPPALIIDALLGTGVDQTPRGPVRSLIEHANELGQQGVAVLSVDIPSGLDADTGLPAGSEGGLAVHATWTVTLVGPKIGFRSPASRPYIGSLHIVDIGVPGALVERLGLPGPPPA